MIISFDDRKIYHLDSYLNEDEVAERRCTIRNIVSTCEFYNYKIEKIIDPNLYFLQFIKEVHWISWWNWCTNIPSQFMWWQTLDVGTLSRLEGSRNVESGIKFLPIDEYFSYIIGLIYHIVLYWQWQFCILGGGMDEHAKRIYKQHTWCGMIIYKLWCVVFTIN